MSIPPDAPPDPAPPPPAAPAGRAPAGARRADDAVQRLVDGEHHDPHAVLGAHPAPDGALVRAYRPDAAGVAVLLPDGSRHDLARVHPAGVFAGVVPGLEPPAPYRLDVAYASGSFVVDDPYRFAPTLGEVDLHLIGEGRHERLWEVLGANLDTVDGVAGARFAVWAPNARSVRVVGDWNSWDGRLHPMRSLGGSGVWELFVPGVHEGQRYKLELLTADRRLLTKADPLARATEAPPRTASVVHASHHAWGDGAWLAGRAARQRHDSPLSIYEVHVGSWREGCGYRELAESLPAYVADLGFTHVELMPVAEHPFGGSWGYQVTGYYSPSARWGTPDEFKLLVDRLHQAGIGVIVDWVPAHFPKDAFALHRFDGTPLYEHADPRLGEHPDWGTAIFNYGRNEVRNFLVANALYWLEEYHVDGLRVDAVASMLYLDYSRRPGEWVPNEHGGRENLAAVRFLQETNATVYRVHPDVLTVAEESTAWPGVTRATDAGGLGFGFKWNMGWMHDTLDYISYEPVHRRFHHDQLTFSLIYAFSETFVLPISHDEVVHGKGSLLSRMPGDRWQRLANLRAFLAYLWSHPGKKLIFMGQELGQGYDWTHDASIDWNALADPAHGGIQALVRDLNRVYRERPALWQVDTGYEGFSWLEHGNADENLLGFVRWSADRSPLAVWLNFSPVPRDGHRIGLPHAGRWREVLNSDAAHYGGTGRGNLGVVEATPEPWHGQPASAAVVLPPLGAVWLVPE